MTSSSSVFPKVAKCTAKLAVTPSLWITTIFEAKLGYGLEGTARSTALEGGLRIQLSAGIFTNKLPRPCRGATDLFCYALQYLAQGITTAAGLDLGAMLGGDTMKNVSRVGCRIRSLIRSRARHAMRAHATNPRHPRSYRVPSPAQTVSWFPFQLSFPAGLATDPATPLLPLLDIPLGASGADVTSLANGIKGRQFCLTRADEIASTDIVASHRRALKFIAFAAGLSGSDLCVGFPGLTLQDDGGLALGMKVDAFLLDPARVSISNMWGLFPSAWSPITNALQTVFTTTYPLGTCVTELCTSSFSIESFLEGHLQRGVKGLGAKQEIKIDFGKLINDVTPSLVSQFAPNSAQNPTSETIYALVFPGFAKASRRRRLGQAVLPPPVPRANRPSVRFWLPNGLAADGTVLPSAALRRRLAGDFDWTLGSSSAIFTSNSHCELTMVGMPKSIVCEITLNFGAVQATLKPELHLGYGMDGSTFVLESFFSFQTNQIPAQLTSAQQSMKTTVDQLPDIGSMIDDSLVGAITLLPFQITLPKMKLGRIELGTAKSAGLCTSTMKNMVPEGLKKIFHYAEVGNSVVGGDVCATFPGATVGGNGFELDMGITMSLFKSSLIDVWKMVTFLANLFSTNPYGASHLRSRHESTAKRVDTLPARPSTTAVLFLTVTLVPRNPQSRPFHRQNHSGSG